jgi:hypothetical protein
MNSSTKPSSAAALNRASHDLIAAAELLGAADGKRESAAALAVALPGLTTALRRLAAATDELRVDTLWLLRSCQPSACCDRSSGCGRRPSARSPAGMIARTGPRGADR